MTRYLRKTLPAAVVLAALTTVGCDDGNSVDGNNPQSSSPDRSSNVRTDSDNSSANMPSRAGDQQGQLDAQTFVNEAASSGLYEVESSRLIAEKVTDAEEKQFAQQMIEDHSKANDELKQIAQSKNLKVPTEMMEKHRKQLEALQSAQGTTLASQYHQQQVTAHQEAVSLFERASQNLSDAELKAFAAKTLPKLQEHLKMVQGHKHGAANSTPSNTPDAAAPSGTSTTPEPGNTGATPGAGGATPPQQ